MTLTAVLGICLVASLALAAVLWFRLRAARGKLARVTGLRIEENQKPVRRFQRRLTWVLAYRDRFDEDTLNVLPPADIPIDELLQEPMAPDPRPKQKLQRRDMRNQYRRLQREFAGAPTALHTHALAISYLRRNTPHTDHARTLFFRLWDERGDWLARRMNGRWLISALQTFREHGRDEAERLAGMTGYVYGNLVKIYEVERTFHTLAPDSPYDSIKCDTALMSIPEIETFNLGSADLHCNLHAMMVLAAQDSPTAGRALVELMRRVEVAPTVFARFDAALAAQAKDVAAIEKRFWSFGKPPAEMPGGDNR